MTIQEFADRIQADTKEEFIRLGYNLDHQNTTVNIKPGKKYTKVNVGGSGKYMVVNETGEIFGIKAYGVIQRGHYYGTLETVDDYYWGRFHGFLKPEPQKKEA